MSDVIPAAPYDPNGLHPRFRVAIKCLMDGLASATPRPYSAREGFRSMERQESLWAQGRTAPGSIVTNCDGLTRKSMHQGLGWFGTGLAADIYPEHVTPEELANPDAECWIILRDAALSVAYVGPSGGKTTLRALKPGWLFTRTKLDGRTVRNPDAPHIEAGDALRGMVKRDLFPVSRDGQTLLRSPCPTCGATTDLEEEPAK